MARQIMDQILAEARAIIADRRRRLRCTEAVTAQGDMCDACLPTAVRFCAVGALINSAFRITGNHEQAHRLGWKIAGLIAKAARLRPVDEGDAGWSNIYSMTRAREAMLRLFRVGDNRAAAVEPKPAIFPGPVAPVVRTAEDGERELVNLNWACKRGWLHTASPTCATTRSSPASSGVRRLSRGGAWCRPRRIANLRA